jgi:hypothetical protein
MKEAKGQVLKKFFYGSGRDAQRIFRFFGILVESAFRKSGIFRFFGMFCS